MFTCDHDNLAVLVHRRTIDMIAALAGVQPSISEEAPTFFLIHCMNSDHETTEIIDKESFERTYGEMPGHVYVMSVPKID